MNVSRLRPLAAGIALAVLGSALAVPAAASAAKPPRPGAPGAGDPYFPLAGNGGYDVRHYGIRLTYLPATRGLTATTQIQATATQDLSRFNLDLTGLTVDRVRVNNRPARFTRNAGELTVTPAHPLPNRRPFTVEVRYHGVPRPIGTGGSASGWLRTRDGIVVASEPTGAPNWFPVDDHPTDKATYTFVVTAPARFQVLANGRRTSNRVHGATRTVTWEERSPMASYLAMVTIGAYRITQSKGPGGIPMYHAVPPRLAAKTAAAFARYRKILDFESTVFGPYPFGSAGNIVLDADLGYALETQTRPIYSAQMVEGGDESAVVHETAHQWFGDSVTPTRWQDIWLNEGFATMAEWLWEEKVYGVPTARQLADQSCVPADSELWTVAPGKPGPNNLFSYSVYVRGALTLAALRKQIGDQNFRTLLRRWAASHRHRNATTTDFIRLAEQISGKRLAAFFTTWLYTPTKPTADLPPCTDPGAAARALRHIPDARPHKS